MIPRAANVAAAAAVYIYLRSKALHSSGQDRRQHAPISSSRAADANLVLTKEQTKLSSPFSDRNYDSSIMSEKSRALSLFFDGARAAAAAAAGAAHHTTQRDDAERFPAAIRQPLHLRSPP